MRLKHNKKRNTAVLFEILAKELTKSIIAKDRKKRKVILSVLKESFNRGSTLKRELSIYNSILAIEAASPRQAEKVLKEATTQYAGLDKEDIFAEQTELINKINKLIATEAFDNFIPSYTAMATAYQLFNSDLSPKNRVILEEQLLSGMVRRPLMETKEHTKVPMDTLVMKTYIKKFNEMFSEGLLEEQQALLQKYINSFADNGLGLKIFLNEEIGRVREVVVANVNKNDDFGTILEVIDSFKGQWITSGLLKKVLKLQELAGELQSDAS